MAFILDFIQKNKFIFICYSAISEVKSESSKFPSDISKALSSKYASLYKVYLSFEISLAMSSLASKFDLESTAFTPIKIFLNDTSSSHASGFKYIDRILPGRSLVLLDPNNGNTIYGPDHAPSAPNVCPRSSGA